MEESKVMQLTPYLVGYFDRQDRAKRLTQPGFMTRELASYHHTRQKELVKKYAEAMALEKLIEAKRGHVVRILVQAQNSDRQAKLLDEAERLNESIEKMRQQVIELLNG